MLSWYQSIYMITTYTLSQNRSLFFLIFYYLYMLIVLVIFQLEHHQKSPINFLIEGVYFFKENHSLLYEKWDYILTSRIKQLVHYF